MRKRKEKPLVLLGDDLSRFVAESNRIEGILREPTSEEIAATSEFLILGGVDVSDLERFVRICEPGAVLRVQYGRNVYIGDGRGGVSYVAPPGGPGILENLGRVLESAMHGEHPHATHVAYEKLHPFTDCNGRSGRVLWAWQMLRQGRSFGRIGFLRAFYYQTLELSRD